MRKGIFTLITFIGLLMTVSCNDYETYGELKEKERDAIAKLISDSNYVIINEEQFIKQDSQTIGDKQFVYLSKSGVYMQLVNKGKGEKIKDGETLYIICRFIEKSIEDTTSINNTSMNIYLPDIMRVTRTGSTYSATFIEGLMYNTYGASVPEGWLVPIQYINIARQQDQLAKVRLIVPHSQGTTNNAKSNVKPYFYQISFQRGR